MQKLYHSISEISELVDEEQHILRYWEKEFDQLKPKKNRGGNRTYSEKDLFIIKTIKHLIRDEKLSLKGAKEHLKLILIDSKENIRKEEVHQMPIKLADPVFTSKESNDDRVSIDKKLILEIKDILQSIVNTL